MTLRKTIARIDPDLVQAWTYHSNVAASLAALFPPHSTVLWNVRHTPYDLSEYRKLTYLLIRYGKWLSWQPACTIYNSQVSAEKHRELGYNHNRAVVIPNGFDVEEFAPSPTTYKGLREKLEIPADRYLVGMVSRYHPMKDHVNFLRAAALLQQVAPKVHFVLVGEGLEEENAVISSLLKQLDLNDRVHLLGRRADIPEITAGLDVATLTSAWGDAFPNVIGEAMSCGVPCVVTNVGDSAFIVGDTGIVVPPRNPDALCQGWKQLLDMESIERQRLGQRARRRIIEDYSLEKIVAQYEALYLEELGQRKA